MTVQSDNNLASSVPSSSLVILKYKRIPGGVVKNLKEANSSNLKKLVKAEQAAEQAPRIKAEEKRSTFNTDHVHSTTEIKAQLHSTALLHRDKGRNTENVQAR